MGVLTNVFYLISTSLLIPVMLALLWSLVRMLLLAGRMLREHSARSAVRDELASFVAALEGEETSFPPLPRQGLVATTLRRLLEVAENDVLAEKVVHDCRLVWESEVERLRGMARLGPALGLMGTLIPLGPALVGLAAGDLQMMSQNLVIAFATTVVGLLVGTLGTTLAGVKKRWYQADAVVITFAANRLPQLESYRVPASAQSDPLPDKAASGNGRHSSCDGTCGCCEKEASHA